MVYIEPDGKHWDVTDTVIHEAVHVYQKMMKYAGEEGSVIEAPAYHIAAIAVNLLKDYDAFSKERKARL